MAESGSNSDQPKPRRITKAPERIPLDAAFENLKARLDYARNVLGFRLEIIAVTARLSEKALRQYGAGKTWLPSVETAIKLDKALAENMDKWIAEARARSRG